ncbi:hypothetical protein QEN19_001055 [Hanseniaspora menglaensis]
MSNITSDNQGGDDKQNEEINFADLVSNILMTTEDQENEDDDDDNIDNDDENEEENEYDDLAENNSPKNTDENINDKVNSNQENSLHANDDVLYANEHTLQDNNSGPHASEDNLQQTNDLQENINQILRRNSVSHLNRRDSVLGDVNNQEWLRLLQNDIRRGSLSNNNNSMIASQRRQSVTGNDADDAFLTNAILQSLKNMNNDGNEQNQAAIESDEDHEDKEAEIDNMKMVDDVLQDFLLQGVSEGQQKPVEVAQPQETALTTEPEKSTSRSKKESKKKRKTASQDDDLQALINQVVSNTLQEHAQIGTKQKSTPSTALSEISPLEEDALGKKKSTLATSKKKKKRADDLDIAKIMKDAMYLAKSKQPGEEEDDEEEIEPSMIGESNQNEFNFDDLDLNLDQIIENTMQPIILQEQASRHQLLQQQQLQVQQRLQAIAKQKAIEKKQQKEEARALRKIKKEEKLEKLEEEKRVKKKLKLDKRIAKEENIEKEKSIRLEKRQQKKEMKEQQKILKSIEKENKRKLKEAEKLARKIRRDHKRQVKERKLVAQQQAAASGLKPTSFITQKLKSADMSGTNIPAYKARLAQIRNRPAASKLENLTEDKSRKINKPLSTAEQLEKYNLPPIPTTDEFGNPLSAKDAKKIEEKILRRLEKEKAKDLQRIERERVREARRLHKEELKLFRIEEKNRRLAYFKQMKKEQELKSGIKSEDGNANFVPGVTEDAVRRAITLSLKPNKSLTSKKRKKETDLDKKDVKKQKLSKEAKRMAKLSKEERRRIRKQKKNLYLPGSNVMELGINPSTEPSLAKTASETQVSNTDQFKNINEKSGSPSLVNVIKPVSSSNSESESDSDSELDEDDDYNREKPSAGRVFKKKDSFYMPPDVSVLFSATSVISKNSLRLIPVVLKGAPFPWYLRVDKLGIPTLPLAKNNTKTSLSRKKMYELKKVIDLNGRDISAWETFKQNNPKDFELKYNTYIRDIQKALIKKFARDVTIDLDLGIVENDEIFELDTDKAHPPFIIPEYPVLAFGEQMIKTEKYGYISKFWLQTLADDTEISKILGNNIQLIKNLKVMSFNKELSEQKVIRSRLIAEERAKEESLRSESEAIRKQSKEERKIKFAKIQQTPQSSIMSLYKPYKNDKKTSKGSVSSLKLLINTHSSLPINLKPPTNLQEILPGLTTHLESELTKIKPFFIKMDIDAMRGFIPVILAYYNIQLQWVSKFQTVSAMRKYTGKMAKNYHKQFEVEKQVLNFKSKLKNQSLEFFNTIVDLVDEIIGLKLNGIIEEKLVSEPLKNKDEANNLKRVNKEFVEQIFLIAMKDAIKDSSTDSEFGSLSTVKLDNNEINKKKRKYDYNINKNENQNITLSLGNLDRKMEMKQKSAPLKIIKNEDEGSEAKFKNMVTKIEKLNNQTSQNGSTSYGTKKMQLVKEMFFSHKFDIPERKNLTRMRVMMKRIQTKVSTEFFKKFELEYRNERMRRYRAIKGNKNKNHMYAENNGKINDNELLNLLVYIQGGSTALAEEILSDMRADSVMPKNAVKIIPKNEDNPNFSVIQQDPPKAVFSVPSENNLKNVENEKVGRKEVIDLVTEELSNKEGSFGQKRSLEQSEEELNESKKQKTSVPKDIEKTTETFPEVETEVDPSLANM